MQPCGHPICREQLLGVIPLRIGRKHLARSLLTPALRGGANRSFQTRKFALEVAEIRRHVVQPRGPGKEDLLPLGVLVVASSRLSCSQRLLQGDFIQTSIYDQYSGSTRITTHLDHTGHCKTTSGSNWSRRQTYRVLSHQHSPRLDFGSGLKFSCLRVGGWGWG